MRQGKKSLMMSCHTAQLSALIKEFLSLFIQEQLDHLFIQLSVFLPGVKNYRTMVQCLLYNNR